MTYLNLIQTNNQTHKIDFVDFDGTEVKFFSKTVEIDDTLNNDVLIEKMIKLSEKNKSVFDTRVLSIGNDNVFSSIRNAAYYVMTDGRIGRCDNLITSKVNIEKFNLNELSIDNEFKIIENDKVSDRILLYRDNGENKPGLIVLNYKDKYKVVEIGVNPHKQFISLMVE